MGFAGVGVHRCTNPAPLKGKLVIGVGLYQGGGCVGHRSGISQPGVDNQA